MFGNYTEVHKENIIANLMSPRTRTVVCMEPSGNIQGCRKFMCFNTGKKIVQRNYTRLPVPDSIIRRVDELAEKERVENGLHFRNRQKGSNKKTWTMMKIRMNQNKKWRPTLI